MIPLFLLFSIFNSLIPLLVAKKAKIGSGEGGGAVSGPGVKTGGGSGFTSEEEEEGGTGGDKEEEEVEEGEGGTGDREEEVAGEGGKTCYKHPAIPTLLYFEVSHSPLRRGCEDTRRGRRHDWPAAIQCDDGPLGCRCLPTPESLGTAEAERDGTKMKRS